MPQPVYRTATFLCQLVAHLPIGTNLGIAHLLWAVLSGQLLQSRGALFPALCQAGLNGKQARRAEAALREGTWKIQSMPARLATMMRRERRAKRLQIASWHPLLIDWVGFFRPRLVGCPSKHFASEAGKALPAIELGMIAAVQQVQERCIPQLVDLNRTGDPVSLLRLARAKQGPQDVLVADRQVKIRHIHEVGLQRFVVRAAQNVAARRSQPPAPAAGKRGRRATRGSVVRPTTRSYRGKLLPATAADREETFWYQGRQLHAKWFEQIVVSGSSRVVSCLVVSDPRYKYPWVLLTDLARVSAQTVYLLYRSRWSIEQLPQTGKQILGGYRSFVHAAACCYRLPELCLLGASLSLYLSATSDAVATGFWDRCPQRTPGRFRRVLAGVRLPPLGELTAGDGRVREKRSVHGHLAKGTQAHCRQARRLTPPAITGK